MIIRIGLENGMDGHSLAWALDLPGCFANGKDGAEALVAMPRAIVNHIAWLNLHDPHQPLKDLKDFDIRLVETFECYTLNDQFELAEEGEEINAFFRDDWRPLTRTEIKRGLRLLDWSSADLRMLVAPLKEEVLDRTYPHERWSIRGILEHIGTAEWWYLDRLDLAGVAYAELPKDVFERLRFTRARLKEMLPTLEGSKLVLGKLGEFWSPRKLLRRALWHELDHIEHIRKLLVDN